MSPCNFPSRRSAGGITCPRHFSSLLSVPTIDCLPSPNEAPDYPYFLCPQLLQSLVAAIREAKAGKRKLDGATADLEAMQAWGLEGLGLAGKLGSLVELLMGFLGDVLSDMAGYVPLEVGGISPPHRRNLTRRRCHCPQSLDGAGDCPPYP